MSGRIGLRQQWPDLLLRLLQAIRTGEDPSLVEEWHGWSVEITDEAGRVVQVIVV